MPYKNISEAESRNPGIRKLPGGAKRIWVSTFNGAVKNNPEETAIKIAWAAVKKKYVKRGESWVSKMEKSHAVYDIAGDKIAIGIPFEKIDTAKRTVEGFATLDNVDKTNEIVDFDASREAFKTWMGNIREMHGPKAVGKALSVEERKHTNNNKEHNGIYVKAFISKGAQDTWEKILDGTLRGFSVGGRVLEKRPEIVKSDDETFSTRNVVRITKYMLGELSVVDNPANPLALFSDDSVKKDSVSLLKFAGEEIEPTDVLFDEQKIFYCVGCDVAKFENVEAENIECVTCDNKMDFIANSFGRPSDEELRKMVSERYEPEPEVVKLGLKELKKELPASESKPESEIAVDNLLNKEVSGNKVKEVLTELKEIITSKIQSHEVKEAATVEASNQGGEEKLDLTSILEVLKGAFEKVEEIMKTAGVQLNNESGDSSFGSPNDVTVADQTGEASVNGSEHATPQVADGGASDAGSTFAAKPDSSNVLPQEPVTKAEETEAEKTEPKSHESNVDLFKSVLTEEITKVSDTISQKVDSLGNRVDEMANRLDAVENSGASRKSGEVAESEDLKKSEESFWRGAFYKGEF